MKRKMCSKKIYLSVVPCIKATFAGEGLSIERTQCDSMNTVNFNNILGQLIGGLLLLLSIAAGLFAVFNVLVGGKWTGSFIIIIIAIGLFKFGSLIRKRQISSAR